MKLKSILVLSALMALFITSALIAIAAGFSPLPFAIVVTAAAFFLSPKMPKGVAGANNIDAGDFVTQLGKYIVFNQRQIWKKLSAGLEWEAMMRGVSGVTTAYTESTVRQTSVLQGWQKGFTPKGTTTITPYVNDVFRAKVDYLLDNIDTLLNGWLNYLADEEKTRDQWPFVQYCVENCLLPKLIEELNIVSAKGVYVAPTAGTAGSYLGTANGTLTVISNEITAGSLTPVVTGSIDSTNAVDQIEAFIDALDPLVQSNIKEIFVSPKIAKSYQRNYRSIFGQTNAPGTKGQLKMDDFGIVLTPVNPFGTSERLLVTPRENLLKIYDKIAQPNSMEVQKSYRDVILMTDFYRGYGFGSLDLVYVNDQA